MDLGQAAITFLLAYLLGSIPFGVILTRLAGTGDLRQIGSGNIGATNVLRTGNKPLAVLTLLLDLGKGLAAVLLARACLPDALQWAAAGALVGHCYPIWLGFRGGKGVATYAGIALGIAWALGAIYATVWIGVLALFRVSSLGGLAAAVVLPIAAWALALDQFVPLLIALSLLVIWQHRENIVRLRRGEETRVGPR